MNNYIYRGGQGKRPPQGQWLTKVLVLVLAVVILAELGVMALELRARRAEAPASPVVEIVATPEAEAERPALELAGKDTGGGGLAAPEAENSEPGKNELAKKDLAEMIGSRPLEDDQQFLEVTDPSGQVLYVRTTLLPELQALANRWVQASRAHQAALVALDPDSGEVLILAGYNADGQGGNPALAGSFPAA
ncbi:MAG: hypothetical protein LBV79_07020, partial [Candidatus Adiutrix sp.]|nr:hypothetical protein [Candidatus Adiutrix sp.]